MKNNQNIFENLDKNIGGKLSIGIARSLWNQEITDKLYKGCISTLIKYGVKEENIKTFEVGGSFELIYAGRYMQDQTIDSIACLDAIILIGSIIKGETPHFEFISQSIINGVKDLNIRKDAPPIILSVSTDLNQQQALDRAGGKLGNKGSDGALTALHLISVQHKLFYEL
ncbi:MAG: 6,7-dimethyl-8-ribityllumazine synthase [Flavobacteriales bacterium]|nr:6,7-dimethyl-8-ribityllumazine synthase [Flavobacteriales bacterium]|tara:strand:- start:185 stop:694 length:510 start_codon:yes stop_codon:yes gene_type:complete